MAENEKNIFDGAADEPSASDIFANPGKESLGADDIFASSGDIFDNIDSASKNNSNGFKGLFAKKTFKTASVIAAIALGGAAVGIVATRSDSSEKPAQVNEPQQTSAPAIPQPAAVKAEPEIENPKADEEIIKEYEGAISFQMAQQLYNQQKYRESLSLFIKLDEMLDQRSQAERVLKDYIALHMGLCLEKLGETELLNRTFAKVLKSESPAIQMLANYHLIFIENRNGNYLEARKRAYRTLSKLELLELYFSSSMESNCYFMIGESVTNYILKLFSEDVPMPGRMWSDSIPIETIPAMSQKQLCAFLLLGLDDLNNAVLGPDIEKKVIDDDTYYLKANVNNAPLYEPLNIIANMSACNIDWVNCITENRTQSTTLYLPETSEAQLTEMLCGSCGLFSRFTGNNIMIFNPENYSNLKIHQHQLIKQAISLWRKYIIKYRGEHRSPNAHYALAKLYELDDSPRSAIAEYKLVYSKYSHHDLAPYALFNSSVLNAKIGDYLTARQDLNELITMYPDCRIIDVATLKLAQATYDVEKYEDSAKLFKKVFSFDTNRITRSQAAIGCGQSNFMLGEYETAKVMLNKGIELYVQGDETEIYYAYYILGKTYMESAEYAYAGAAFGKALEKNNLPAEIFAQVSVSKAIAENKQQNEVQALKTLEKIKLEKLSQEMTCNVLITKSQTYRQIGLYDIAASMLRHKSEYIASRHQRGRLLSELAKTHIAEKKYEVAYHELIESVGLLDVGNYLADTMLELARVSNNLEKYNEAIDSCHKILENSQNENIRRETLKTLGLAYRKIGDFQKAALVLSGNYNDTL